MVKPPSRKARHTDEEEMMGREGSHGDRGCNQPAWKYQKENSAGEKIWEDKRMGEIMSAATIS